MPDTPTFRSSPSPLVDRLAAVGFAYVRFAQEQPHVFALMMRPELRGGRGFDSPVGRAAQGAYRVLENGVRACQEAGLLAEGDPASQALLAWSGVHGLAVLINDQLLETPVESVEAGEQLTLSMLTAMGIGLFVRPEPTAG